MTKLFVDPLGRLLLLSFCSSVYYFATAGGVINGTSAADIAASWGLTYFAALWAQHDSERSGYWPAYHYGLWLWLAAHFLVPYYVVRTRGRGGVGLAVVLVGALWLPLVAGLSGYLLWEYLPDLR